MPLAIPLSFALPVDAVPLGQRPGGVNSIERSDPGCGSPTPRFFEIAFSPRGDRSPSESARYFTSGRMSPGAFRPRQVSDALRGARNPKGATLFGDDEVCGRLALG